MGQMTLAELWNQIVTVPGGAGWLIVRGVAAVAIIWVLVSKKR